jgi:hypothetical protein
MQENTQKHRQVGGSRAIFPTEQHAGLWRCAIPNVGWNVIRRSDGHTEMRISSPTHRAISVIFPCRLQSFNPFVQQASTKEPRPNKQRPTEATGIWWHDPPPVELRVGGLAG